MAYFAQVRTVQLIDTHIIYLFNDVQELSESIGLSLNMESFLNELYDMTHPADPTRITCKDLIRSRVGGTVISLLIDSELLHQSQQKE